MLLLRKLYLSLLTFLFGLASLTLALGQTIPSELDIETAVRIAVEHHPALAAAGAVVAGTEGLLEQSRVRPNPHLTLQSENWRFYGDPSFDLGQDLDFFAYGTQPIERGGKRERRVELAEQGQQVAELRLAETNWRIRQDVRLAFWRALLAQSEEELLRENARVFGQVTQYHEARVREGAMAELDLIRVRLEEDKLRLQSEAAAAETVRARNDLLKAMGLPSSQDEFRLRGDVRTFPQGGAGLDQLVQMALESRADLQVAQAELESARRGVALETAQAKPDWDVIFGYKRTAGFNTLLGGVMIPLPFFDKNFGNIQFRRTEVDRLEAMLREKQMMARVAVQGAVKVLAKRVEMLSQVDQGMVQRAEESWQIAQAAYREGATDLLRFLDAQRSLNEVRLLRNRMKLEVQIGIADLEEAVGSAGLPIGMETFRAEN
jgi:cobalt-zinc-cadmium efflux system outer membrane protein